MRSLSLVYLLFGGLLVACAASSLANGGGHERRATPPKNAFPRIGSCYEARIASVGSRFEGLRPSKEDGTQVVFDNGVFQVDYGLVPEILRSRVGDKVTMCVIRLPNECPPGDYRGVVYRTRNWRTGEHWKLPNSQHNCGGA
jgi:hypothetical protein